MGFRADQSVAFTRGQSSVNILITTLDFNGPDRDLNIAPTVV